MQERVSQPERTMYVLHAEVSELKELLVSAFKKLENNFELIKNQLSKLNLAVKMLGMRVETLKGSTSEGFEDVRGRIETLTEEIVKIGKVTRYDDYFRNLEQLKNYFVLQN